MLTFISLVFLAFLLLVDVISNPCRYFGHKWFISPIGKSHVIAFNKDGQVVGFVADVFECNRDYCTKSKIGKYRRENECK